MSSSERNPIVSERIFYRNRPLNKTKQTFHFKLIKWFPVSAFSSFTSVCFFVDWNGL